MAKKSKSPARKRKKYARTGKILTRTLYAYVEPGNQRHALAQGKKPKYGTTSGYINAMIAKDRGVKPKGGTKGQGELKRPQGKKLLKAKSSKGTVGKRKSLSKNSSTKNPVLRSARKRTATASPRNARTGRRVTKLRLVKTKNTPASAKRSHKVAQAAQAA